MNDYEWTEKDEAAYQEKLAQKPILRPFDPDKLPAHQQAVREWFASLSPGEKLRYQVDREAIIL